ncbi:MAG: beta-propeller fold lactonase family protein [Chloroflexi bacterium]|nr:beta-propeller fold lactonase family protein [Chloroflexota bacterium]
MTIESGSETTIDSGSSDESGSAATPASKTGDVSVTEEANAPPPATEPLPTIEPSPTTGPPPIPEPTSTLEPEPTETIALETATDTEESTEVDEPVPDSTSTDDISSAVAVPKNINTAFILDASGSMLADLGSRTRLAIAQDAIGNLSAGLPASINASLWVYGHRVEKDNKAESCRDIEQVIELGPVDSKQFDTVAHSFAAKGYTPITDALLQAASSLPVGLNERNTIVLVSDGEETCGGDPCALAAELAASDSKLVIHTIGLAVDDVTRAQLQCIADVSGGTYTDADSAEDLSLALEEAAEAAADDTFSIVEGLGRPSVVVVSPDGRNVYVTGAGAGSVVVFSREPDTGQLTFLEVHVNGIDGVLGLSSPQGLAISPDGKHVYATGGDDLAMAIFSRNPDTGSLTFVEAVDVFGSVAGVDSARAVAVSPDNLSVYVTGKDDARTDDAIAVYSRNADTGRLSPVEMVQEGVNGVAGLNALTGITVSPDNRNVYAANIWHTMAVFNRDPDTGALTFVQVLEDKVDVANNGLLGAHVVAVSPDNRHVYVTGRRGDTVTVFGRNPDTGALTFTDQLRGKIGNTTANLDGAHGLAISPDGQHVYVASDNIDMLLNLSRDPQAGTLALMEEFTDNMAGVDGLENGWSIAVSPDGRNVYVAGFDDDSLSVFTRDVASGSLAFTEVIRNKVGQ